MDYTDILIDIRKIVRSINLESKRIEKQYGISIPQLLCLDYLKNKEDFQASNGELKNFLKLNASTITGLISRLEKKGLIAKLPKKADKRVSYITITAYGVKLLESIPPLMHERLTQKLQTMPEDELNQMQKSFKQIVKIMDIEDVDAAPIITYGDMGTPTV
ncbi:MarR family transcriptional regulator [Limibacter armeniacum]|uniref:MarR family winged helix-turn-helix transcriptional regulator n=1 Tax=Limibacter armeniacum TaxID=466084 RepID=UPI002FE5AD15